MSFMDHVWNATGSNQTGNATGIDIFIGVTPSLGSNVAAPVHAFTDDVTTEAATSYPTVFEEEENTVDYTYFPLSLCMIAVSLAANALVVIVTRLEIKLRTASNRYICSLAVADLCVTVSVMVPFMLYNVHESWPFGAPLCTLWICCDFSLCTVSMLHLCLIALDRYKAIAQPHSFTKKQRVRRITREIFLTWVVGFGVWTPVVMVFRYGLGDADRQEGDCYYMPAKEYVLVQSVLVYYVPMAIMVLVYVLMVRALRNMDLKWTKYVPQTNKQMDLEDSVADTVDSLNYVNTANGQNTLPTENSPNGNNTQPTENSPKGTKTQLKAHTAKTPENYYLSKLDNKGYVASEDSGIELRYSSKQDIEGKNVEVFALAYNSHGHHVDDYLTDISLDGVTTDASIGPPIPTHVPQALKRKRKHEALTRMIGLVILAFLICWLPFFVLWPISAFHETLVPDGVYAMSYWMAYLNSALNPILYFIMNGDFRLGAVNFFHKLCRVKVTCQRPSRCGCQCI